MSSRNEEVKRLLEARERAAEQNAKQRKRAKVGVLDHGYVRNSLYPSNKRPDKRK